MIYALKLLIVVSVVACVAGYMFRSAFRDIFTPAEYKRIWQTVLLGVLLSYLCQIPAVFLVAIGVLGLWSASATGRGPAGKFAIYVLLACTLPPISVTVGGFGGINYVLQLDHRRILSIVLLGWAAVEIMSTKASPRSSKSLAIDILVVAYQCLRIGLIVPHATYTTLARAAVEAVLDILLPYFVVTRGVRSMADLRLVCGHLLMGLAFAAGVAVAEALLQHNLYSGLQTVYGIHWQQTYALMRGSLIRVQSITPQPIILAFMLLYGLAIAYWLKGQQWRRPSVLALFAAIAVAEVATFSRGPWIAAVLIVLALVAMRRLPGNAFRFVLVALLIGGVGLKFAGADQQVLDALGALFGSDQSNIASIEYRRQLLDTSLALIKQSPWLGVPNYAAHMQDLKQGEGIIDLVNSYLAILLDAGVIGLTIYLLPFLIVLNRLISAIRRPDPAASQTGNRFAMAFSALIIGCLFAIFTASTFNIIPVLLTLLLSLPTAWLALPLEERNAAGARADLELDIPDDPLRRHAWAGGRLS
ncbi:O-antigen ligase family protein [Scleromatobacter humisilvae]|uniref:O-antigen ligase family protein n=1 Tax=Scleromatobacter humisilvae TaxID=2897159 RepID=A0A9X1YQ74_9BURK|nr:O-antigen ligase family protein [Scleromatobacter humisilvae]MCK9685866.1 O-antigen ligase family protein [Scleromatobacter humisilvae]